MLHMLHSPFGIAQRKTDTVKCAMEILKDRPMPEPNPHPLRYFGVKVGVKNKTR
jgi:hypothetical protein